MRSRKKNQKPRLESIGYEEDEEDESTSPKETKNESSPWMFNKHLDHVQDAIRSPRIELPPCIPLIDKQYSLEADMIFGWRPKFILNGPIPLKFNDRVLENIVSFLDKNGGQLEEDPETNTKYKKNVIVYQGFRPNNTYSMHEKFTYQSAIPLATIEKYKFHSKYIDEREGNPKRPFYGMNPGISCDSLFFDAHFEGGNLDTAIRTGKNEYELYIRVDTNTRGHTNWYYFKVTNMRKGQQVRFKIMNFSRRDNLYSKGMKPYIYSKSAHQFKGKDWKQNGEDVMYGPSTFKYCGETFDENEKYFQLSFLYTFNYDEDEVSFALCVPYTYSRLITFIQTIKETTYAGQCQYIQESTLCNSLGGIRVPMLTISQPADGENIKRKQYIVCTGRIHPGETNGSWMVEGFLKELCSDSQMATFLRKHFIFKIIPMLNPDGVVIGNHRTGFCGKDLNRQFAEPMETYHPTIVALKKMMDEIVFKKRAGVFAYLDFHGHSQKKNVFMYGAQFPVYSSSYYRVKIIPKLISKKTDMFRFYSCVFRISPSKLKTCRAIFSLDYGVSHYYTIEASYGSYFTESRETQYFDAKKFQEMGFIVLESLYEYELLIQEEVQMKMDKRIKASSGSPVKERNMAHYEPVATSNMSKTGGFNIRGIILPVTQTDFKKDGQRAKTPAKLTTNKSFELGDFNKKKSKSPGKKKVYQNDPEEIPKSGIQKLIEEIKFDLSCKKMKEKDDNSEGSNSEQSDNEFEIEMEKMQKKLAEEESKGGPINYLALMPAHPPNTSSSKNRKETKSEDSPKKKPKLLKLHQVESAPSSDNNDSTSNMETNEDLNLTSSNQTPQTNTNLNDKGRSWTSLFSKKYDFSNTESETGSPIKISEKDLIEPTSEVSTVQSYKKIQKTNIEIPFLKNDTTPRRQTRIDNFGARNEKMKNFLLRRNKKKSVDANEAPDVQTYITFNPNGEIEVRRVHRKGASLYLQGKNSFVPNSGTPSPDKPRIQDRNPNIQDLEKLLSSNLVKCADNSNSPVKARSETTDAAIKRRAPSVQGERPSKDNPFIRTQHVHSPWVKTKSLIEEDLKNTEIGADPAKTCMYFGSQTSKQRKLPISFEQYKKNMNAKVNVKQLKQMK